MRNMISQKHAEKNGLYTLLEAAQSLGDHPGSHRHHHLERNDLHEYARSPTERDHSAKEPRVRERKGDDRVHIEPKERQRPGGRLEHNRLEKDRRAQLKENFNRLKEVVPSLKDKKASNQAILKGTLKYIQTFKQDEEKHKRVMQNLSAEKILFMKQLNAAKERFEKAAGYSADIYLRDKIQEDIDMASISTLSATEGPENMEDVDVELREMGISSSSSVQTVDFEEQPGPQLPSSSQGDSSSRQLKGIPHSVIKPVPGNHRLEAEGGGTLSGVHKATLKKVQAKITSTKQPTPLSTNDGSERSVVAASAVQQVIVTPPTPPPTTFQPPPLPPAAASYPSPAGSMPRLSMPRRVVGHSLLTHAPGSLVPLFHTTTATTPVTSVVVPSTVQGGHALLPADVQRLRSVNTFFEGRQLIPPNLIVTADPMSLFMKQQVPSVVLVSRPLPSATTNPAVSSNVAL